MSMSDNAWRRTLFVGAGLALVPIPLMIIFISGGYWGLVGIQLIIAILLFVTGFRNKREASLTRILLVFAGIVAVIMGLIGFLAVSQESELNSLWKAVRVCAIDDIIVGILAFYSCI